MITLPSAGLARLVSMEMYGRITARMMKRTTPPRMTMITGWSSWPMLRTM
jgi:hypothetical protein